MSSFKYLVATVGALLMIVPTAARAQADSVVLRITSPRGTEVTFSGVLTLKGSKTERRLEKVRTPFEITLAAQDIDARFSASDGGALSGEILAYRQGKQHGHVSGTMYFGEVKLYFQPDGSFGFGSRLAQRILP